MPITPEQIASLIDSSYRHNIPGWNELPGDPLQRVTLLRRSYPVEIVPVILELSELRHRAKAKFSHAEEMFFDREGLEQSTSQDITKARVRYFQEAVESTADLTCGDGGDSLEFARCIQSHHFVCDISAARVRIARANIEALLPGTAPSITFRVSPARDYPKADAYFIDPSRRSTGRRSRHLANMSPSVSLIQKLSREARALAVKLSPATPDEELAMLCGRTEFVSHRGECKEAVVWYGSAGPDSGRSATINGLHSISVCPGTSDPEISPPLNYILEPDPAIVRAGLIPELCKKINAAVMDPRIAYLTSDTLVHPPFVTTYKILAAVSLSVKAIKGALRDLGIGQVDVKKRGVAQDVDTIRKLVRSDLAGRGVVLMTRIGNERRAFICEVPELVNQVS